MSSDNQIKITSPSDLLSIIPFALGYQPLESLVVACVRTTGKLGMVARTSLSDLADKGCCAQIAKMVAQNAADDGVAKAFLVFYSKAMDEFSLIGLKKHAKCFAAAFAPAPAEAWVVGETRYFCLDCDGDGCCPVGGFDTETLRATAPSAELVYRGYAPAVTRTHYLGLPAAAPSRLRAARSAEAKALASLAAEPGRLAEFRKTAFTAWQQLCTHDDDCAAGVVTAKPAQLARLAVGLRDVGLRDAVLISCLPGGGAAAQKLAHSATSPGDAVRDVLNAVVGQAEAAEPELVTYNRHCAVLEQVAAHASTELLAGPLALLGFLAWWAGDGTKANCRLEQALDADANNQLAQILRTAMENQVRPGWVRAAAARVPGGGASVSARAA